MRNAVFIFLFFAFGSGLCAQQICGTVLDNNDKPIPFATLILEDANDNSFAIADTNGHFCLKLSDYSMAMVKVSCVGYEDLHYMVKPSGKKSYIIRLNRSANMLNTVVITGTRTHKMLKDSPVLTRVISSAEIYNQGSETALDALENLIPGVFFNPNAMGDNIQMQGLNNKYILILVDGERMVNERTENVNFSRLNTADIKQIEVVNGAASVLYGSNAMGAVINIITKDVDRPVEGFVQGRYSNFNTYAFDAGVGIKEKGFSSKTTFNTKSTDGYMLQSDNGTPPKKTLIANPYTDYTISELLKYKFNEKFNAELKGVFYTSNVEKDEYQSRLGRNYTVAGKVNYVEKKNVLTLSGNTDIYKGYTRFTQANDSTAFDNDSYYTTFRLLDVFTPSKKIQVVGGAEYNVESTYSAQQFGQNKTEESTYSWGIFGQGEFNFWKDFDGIVGLRMVNSEQFGTHIAPKFSLMYCLGDFRFRANVSNGYKEPTLKEMYMNYPHVIGSFVPFYIIGNPDLKPESSWYESLSAEYTIKNMNFSATVYNNDISNKINAIQRYNATLNRQELYYQNVSDAKIYGVDLMAQITFLEYFSANVSYAYANAIDKSDDSELEGNSKHNAVVGLSYKRSEFRIPFTIITVDCPFNITFSGRVASPRITETGTSNGSTDITIKSETKVTNIWKIVYSQKLPLFSNYSFDLQFGIDNLFNWTDVMGNSINPGRTYFGSVRFNF